MIIGFCGTISAGKETLKEFLVEKGFSYNETSKILKAEMEKNGIEITREKMQDYGDKLRKEFGGGALMRLFLKNINPNKNHIIDSLRNPLEAEELKNSVEDFILIGIDAPREIRFNRMIQRGKPSDPKTWEEFLEIDNRDICDKENPFGQQTGKCLEIADFVIYNDGDLEKAKKQVEEIWEEIRGRC